MPRNLRPSLEDAHDDEALPFRDGCHVRFLETDLPPTYDECRTWRTALLRKVRQERPAVVVLDVARHYGPEWRFAVQGGPWLQGLRTTVADLRATGARVLVLSPTPWPRRDVPECLAEHRDQVSACAFSRASGVSTAGAAAERAAVEAAGGEYVDVADWLCTPAVCPVVVGDVLVYRDDNHITTDWVRTVGPLLAQRVEAALAR